MTKKIRASSIQYVTIFWEGLGYYAALQYRGPITESGDIQNSDVPVAGTEGNAFIDSGDNIVEKSAVDGFR